MDPSSIDIFVTRNIDGYVVAPAGARLPADAMEALGGVVHGWTQQIGEANVLPGWRGVRNDLDACGYSVLSEDDFMALLLPRALAPPPRPIKVGATGALAVAA
ncbi:hypothetical protein LDO32_08925 [Luteimonas sp. Y-2-2-4F]|nr:hypothetical protein [Luteimonas sp. Y-2-2-4F]MCD9031583.1 hypothetical protein [Luteimonas sp. Y-2-2-4F]MCD9031842.1 hypothetical protein [Luteimonas sp. Y-2-2-4F]